MPKCKNNLKKTYKGTEPSPKGKGWCEGGMEEGVTKKGTDGNKWIVASNKLGHKRWKKDTKTKSKTKSTLKSTTKSKTTSTNKSVDPVDSRPFWVKGLDFLFNVKPPTYIDPSKYVYLTITPFYYTEEALKVQYAEYMAPKQSSPLGTQLPWGIRFAEGNRDEIVALRSSMSPSSLPKEFKFKKNDISDAAIEKKYKKLLTEWFYLFQENEDHVTLVKTKKKQNKIKFTLKYDKEKVDIKDEVDMLLEGFSDRAVEDVFIKKFNNQKIYVTLFKQDITLTQ